MIEIDYTYKEREKNVKIKSLLAPVICSTLFLAACSSQEASTEESAKVAVNVEIATAEMESLDAISSLSGTLLPYEETTVSFGVGGVVEDATGEVGDTISVGTVLMNVEATEYELQVKNADNAIAQAEAALNSSDAAIKAADTGVNSSGESVRAAEANITSANASINSAQASLESVVKGAREQEKAQAKLAVDRAKTAYNNVKVNADRIKSLYDEGLASKKEYDDSQLQLASAQTDLKNSEQSYSLVIEGATEAQKKQAEAAVQQAQAGKAQAQAGVGQSLAAKEQAVAAKEQATAAKGQAEAVYEQALIGKEQAQLTLAKTRLQSPISGVIMEKLVQEGQRVNPGDPVYKLGNTSQLKVLLPVPDKDIKTWKNGDKVTIQLYDEQKTGTVSKIFPRTNANSGTISVEVVIPNEEATWVPGQIVNANRVTSDNAGILVPIEAVISNGASPYVFLEVEGQAVKAEVETGKLVDNKIHIISGINEGDQVVIRGGELLLDGDPLKTGGGTDE